MSLPLPLKYGGKIESAPSRSSRLNLAPQNGTGNYNLGDTIIFNFPCRNNVLLVPSESYLRLNVAVTNSEANIASYRLDSCGMHSIIRSIRIWSGSNILSDIDSYSTLAKMLFDLQVPTSASYGKYSALAGTRSDLVVTGTGQTPVQGTAALVNGIAVAAPAGPTGIELAGILNSLSVSQINTGDLFAASVAVGATTTTTTYCLNLITLLGALCQNNYFPLFACQNSTIRMEITLHDNLQKIFGIATPTAAALGLGSITVSNVEYICNLIELGDGAMSMVQESLQGAPLQFVLSDWRNFQYTTAVTANALINVPIAAKFASLKSLFMVTRDRFNRAVYYPNSSVTGGLLSYYYRVGAQIMPAKAPSTIPEFFAEVMKAIASMSDLSHMPSIDKASYAIAASNLQTPATLSNGSTSSGSFYIGIDLESYPNASKQSCYAGWNSNSDDIFCSLQYGAATTDSMRFDSFANFDNLLVFEHGVCFSRF